MNPGSKRSVGDGGRIPVLVQGFIYDAHGLFDLRLDGFQQFVLDILGEEGLDLILEVKADVAQAGGARRGGRFRGGYPAVDSGAVG